MSEKLNQNPEYLEHHPNAEQNVEVAHGMAKASDRLETGAAVVRLAGDMYADYLEGDMDVQSEFNQLEGKKDDDWMPDDTIRFQALKFLSETMSMTSNPEEVGQRILNIINANKEAADRETAHYEKSVLQAQELRGKIQETREGSAEAE